MQELKRLQPKLRKRKNNPTQKGPRLVRGPFVVEGIPDRDESMIVLGITGGIATGKSTVTRMFAEHGAAVVDADAIARELLAAGSDLSRAVAEAFPTCVRPGDSVTVDRKALGALVFANPEARARLEALTHPAILRSLNAQISELRLRDEAPLVVAEIPLLYEVGLETQVDRVLVAACDEPLQIARLAARLGIPANEAAGYLGAQLPLAQKIARADFVIRTDASLADTQRQVDDLFQHLIHSQFAGSHGDPL